MPSREIVWRTTETPKRGSGFWWKESMGEECPHGHHLFLVRGPHIRNTYSSDFVQGDNFCHSPKFVPKGEIWIDSSMPREEWPYVAFHECVETEEMLGGKDYEQAHDVAQRKEDHYRKLNLPGER